MAAKRKELQFANFQGMQLGLRLMVNDRSDDFPGRSNPVNNIGLFPSADDTAILPLHHPRAGKTGRRSPVCLAIHVTGREKPSLHFDILQ